MATSRPVVNKYGPAINCYANVGLDKLEDKVPLVKREPEEIKQVELIINLTSKNRAVAVEHVFCYIGRSEI